MDLQKRRFAIQYCGCSARYNVPEVHGNQPVERSMSTETFRFSIFILVSLAVFFFILRFVMRHRVKRASLPAIAVVSAIVVVGGMIFAKFGNNAGLPWWIYYTVPALVTLLLPPIAFKLSGQELWSYLLLAFLSSPIIHALFSFFLGWHEYMPFLRIPSLKSLIS
jgi:hypothetical protein